MSSPLPPEYTARCTDTACSWKVSTDVQSYRDRLVEQHAARYGHKSNTLDHP